jgi:hypothetical protein
MKPCLGKQIKDLDRAFEGNTPALLLGVIRIRRVCGSHISKSMHLEQCACLLQPQVKSRDPSANLSDSSPQRMLPSMTLYTGLPSFPSFLLLRLINRLIWAIVLAIGLSAYRSNAKHATILMTAMTNS